MYVPSESPDALMDVDVFAVAMVTEFHNEPLAAVMLDSLATVTLVLTR